MLLRLAEEWDAQAILDHLIVPDHAENGFLPLNPEKALAYVRLAIGESRILIVVEADKLVGMLGFERQTPEYTDASILTDFFYYVVPEHRGDSVARELLTAYKTIASNLGLPAFITKAGKMALPSRKAELFGFLPLGYTLRVA